MSTFCPPKKRGRLVFLAAIGCYVLTRVYILFFFQPLYSDVLGYFEYALNGVDLGLVPYREVPLEYPPPAYWAMALPRVLSSHTVSRADAERGAWGDAFETYVRGYRREMALVELVAFIIFLALVRRRRPEFLTGAAWAYVLLTASLAHVLYDRLDAGLAALVLAWAWCWLRAGEKPGTSCWSLVAALVLGFAIAYKLIPIVLVPLVIAAELKRGREYLNGKFRRVINTPDPFCMGLIAVVPFVWYYHEAGWDVLRVFTYHAERGLEIESLWASIAMALRPLGYSLAAVHSHGSWNIAGPAAAWLLPASSVALGLIVILPMAGALWPGVHFDRVRAYRWGLLVLLGSLIASKVISVQYLVWGFPLALLAGVEFCSRRQFAALVAALLIVAALTSWVFPYLFFAQHPSAAGPVANAHPLVPTFDWLPCTLLALRNALLLGSVTWLAMAAWLRRPRPLPELPPVVADCVTQNVGHG